MRKERKTFFSIFRLNELMGINDGLKILTRKIIIIIIIANNDWPARQANELWKEGWSK